MNGWYKPTTPRKVSGGIAARTKRGSIGREWWSRRFIDLLETICDSGRLSRGRRYARAGQVLDLALRPGRVTARVQGSRARPYTVQVEVEPFDDTGWDTAFAELRSQALFRAKLLAGELPLEIEELFDSIDLPLFPADVDQWNLECSCPDWGWPCKHLSAVLYVLAESFDDDPFQVLALRGRDREQVLESLRSQRGSSAGADSGADRLAVSDVPFAERLDDFYSPRGSVSGVSSSGRRPTAVAPDLLLQITDPPDWRIRGHRLAELLRPAYERMAGHERVRE